MRKKVKAAPEVAPEVQEDFSISLDSSVNNVKKSTLTISGIESVFEDNFGVASYELKVNGKSFMEMFCLHFANTLYAVVDCAEEQLQQLKSEMERFLA